ncbi:MAG: ATP-dependent DNA/RNA helicase [Thelocarpon superellum]|nr:MAG: ATP-dependent DNA/RNA helicase [Thelocarpon superellum]
MKRKLDEDNVPMETSSYSPSSSQTTFSNLGLDSRILQGVLKEQYPKPTPVQAAAIPLALEGKDILARAKTGSGKTAAYLLPILHSILKRKTSGPRTKCTSALILVPTRELAEQVYRTVNCLSSFCAKDIRAVNLTHKVSEAVQRSLLADEPDVVISTPARASLNLKSSALSVQSLAHLVIDEADLVLSYDYEDDLQHVARTVPQGVQTFLMSATLSDDVDTLKGLFCRDPVVLRLDEAAKDDSSVSQFVVRCGEEEKFLLLYVIFKLRLVKGKCIVFVGDIDRCYRLKLFLEQFGTKSCVLNSELPVNSRIHVVGEFNKNVYDIIIATDENEVMGDEEEAADEGVTNGQDEGTLKLPNGKEQASKPDRPRKAVGESSKRQRKDKEYGISRGIDFKNVACVLNFDLPTTSKSYTHRIGRTARAGNTGMALSFMVPAELYGKHKPLSFPTTQHDEAVLAKIRKQQAKSGQDVQPYHFDMKQVSAFRYRMGDALRAVTRIAIREARTRELRQELLKSEKLKRHFEENPGDLHHLRHDGELRAARVQSHLKHVPAYLLPKEGRKALTAGAKGEGEGGTRDEKGGFMGLARNKDRVDRRGRGGGRGGKRPGGKVDPLKSFKARRLR